MSVLQRSELEDSPLADLHAIASELGIEGYRALRRERLVAAILNAGGGEVADEVDPAEPAADSLDSEVAADEPARPARARRERGGRRDRGRGDDSQPDDEADEAETETVTGALDVLPNGSGFLRVGGPDKSTDDVYVAPAQIKRCELRAGDEVTGPVRRARRSERHRSLVRIAEVNGRDPEAPPERPLFEGLTPVHATERLPAPPALAALPFGKGSRVAIAGGPGAGATRLLHEIAHALGADAPLTVALVGARPEEVTDWGAVEGAAVVGGSFDGSLDAQVQAAELAIERGKRAVEGGGDAVVIIDSLEAVPAAAARRIFGAGRKVKQGGSLTVIVAVGGGTDALRQASTRVVLDDAADAPTVVRGRSGTQRADLLA